NSVITTDTAHSGNSSLHLVVAPGGLALDTFYQLLPPINSNTVYTLSFWFFAGSRGSNFNARLNTSFRATMNPRPVQSTPGVANASFATLPPYPTLWLNEVQPGNTSGIQDGTGAREPWIELYNAGSNTVNLSGLFLADNYETNLTQWAFPNGSSI